MAILAFAEWVGSLQTIRSFYLRALEREIRRHLEENNKKTSIESYGDPERRDQLWIISLEELCVEYNSMSGRKSTPGNTMMMIVIGCVFVGYLGAIIALSVKVDLVLQLMMYAVYGTFATIIVADYRAVNNRGRGKFHKIVESYQYRLGKDLLEKMDKSDKPVGRSRAIPYAFLPRPDDIVKGFFSVAGVLLAYLYGKGYSLWIVVAWLIVIEFLVYQVRYILNDFIDLGVDREHPSKGSRDRIENGAEGAAWISLIIRVSLAVMVIVYIIFSDGMLGPDRSWDEWWEAISSGKAKQANLGIRLIIISLGVFVVAVPYEWMKNFIRKRESKSRLHVIILLILVTLGYPLRMVGALWGLSGLNLSDLPWIQLSLMASSLGVVFVAPTLVLECFSYVNYSASESETRFAAQKALSRKSHLMGLANLCGWDIQYEDERENECLWSEFDGKNKCVLKRVPGRLRVPWLWAGIIYQLALLFYVLSPGGIFASSKEYVVFAPAMAVLVIVAVGIACTWGVTWGLAAAAAAAMVISIAAEPSLMWWVIAAAAGLPYGLLILYSGNTYESTRSVFEKKIVKPVDTGLKFFWEKIVLAQPSEKSGAPQNLSHAEPTAPGSVAQSSEKSGATQN